MVDSLCGETMSAAEVIELIKKLPPEERAAVAAFVNEGTTVAEPQVKYLSKEEVEKIAPEIFTKHHELFRKLAQ